MQKINDVKFSDIYITPDKVAYIADISTGGGLKLLEAADFHDFMKLVEQSWDGAKPSYSIFYENIFYRIERSVSIFGVRYCGRKMPVKVPDFHTLGFNPKLAQYLLSLSKSSGLLLWSGSTSSGKTTSISSLLKEYLSMEGGFAYTIEDPNEMPLDGIYTSSTGKIGLCQQNLPPNGIWGEGLKSALRSKPNFILVGEIRTSDTASEVLRAATSGHLVLSTIHASNITDAISSLVKYAASADMSEELAYDLVSQGILGVMHQTLAGIPKAPVNSFLFANPDVTEGDQVRAIIKSGNLNLGTVLEAQAIRMVSRNSLFQSSQ